MQNYQYISLYNYRFCHHKTCISVIVLLVRVNNWNAGMKWLSSSKDIELQSQNRWVHFYTHKKSNKYLPLGCHDQKAVQSFVAHKTCWRCSIILSSLIATDNWVSFARSTFYYFLSVGYYCAVKWPSSSVVRTYILNVRHLYF